MKRLFLSLLFISTTLLLPHGFSPSTWVTMSDGTYQSLGQLCTQIAKKKKVVVATADRSNHQRLLCGTVKYGGYSQSDAYIRLGFDEGYDEFSQDDVVCTSQQELYVPARGGWTQAYLLRPGDEVAVYNNTTATVTFVQGVREPLTVYTLHVPDTELFFVGKHRVMAHNTVLSVAFSLAPGLTSITAGSAVGGVFAGPLGVLGGIAVCGITVALQALLRKKICSYKNSDSNSVFLPNILYAKNNQKNKLPVLQGGNSPQNGKKNNDDEDTNKHPNGVYIDTDYHHQQSKGLKSPAPKNGQKALDHSEQIKSTSKKRIGVADAEIVELKHSINNRYHGYVIKWDEVTQMFDGEKIKKILKSNNWVDKKGKVLL